MSTSVCPHVTKGYCERDGCRTVSRFKLELPGKAHGEYAPHVQGAVDLDFALHGFRKSLGQAETQPDAALGPALIAAVEALKNMGKVLFGDTDA
jgi:hypothetical protein